MRRLAAGARHLWIGVLDLAYPHKCLVCGRLDPERVCARCRGGFLPLTEPLCPRCGAEMLARRCAECASGLPAHASVVRAAGRFHGPLREAILRLKYDRRRLLAEPLGQLAADVARRAYGGAGLDVVVPVPLHPSRLAERSFNQAALLGDPVARALCLPLGEHALRRVRRTRPQADLPAHLRGANVAGAFVVADPEAVMGRRILLIDDVATTLHTVDECARVLTEAGAQSVSVLAVARGGVPSR